MSFILVGLRSNILDGMKPFEQWLAWAMEKYGPLQISNIYRTEGQGLSQGWLAELWAVARIETKDSHFQASQFDLGPSGFKVETTMLCWGNEVLMNPERPLPCPDLHRKRVFLQCSAELEPKLVHPILELSLMELVNLDQRPLEAEFFAQGRRTLNKA